MGVTVLLGGVCHPGGVEVRVHCRCPKDGMLVAQDVMVSPSAFLLDSTIDILRSVRRNIEVPNQTVQVVRVNT